MRNDKGEIRLSATDLASHLGCRHLTSLDLLVAHGEAKRPVYNDPGLEALWERGLEHEKAYLDRLRAEGRVILSLPESEAPQQATERTVAAMREGVDVIAQGTLALDRWHGRTDVLLRVDTPSNLGNYSYEVLDTKLARETKGGTILQLCLYSSLVEEVQGTLPEYMYVVTPGVDFEPEQYRVRDFYAYYNLVRDRLVEHVDSYDPATRDVATYPEPCTQCDICVWWKQCDTQWRDDDNLCLVAGISRMQRRELEGRSVGTLEALANIPIPLDFKPSRGAANTYERVREQARVQLEGRESGAPVHEMLPIEEDQGLCRLPEPSYGDVFFDFEGARYVGEGGLEYLFGYVTVDTGKPVFNEIWAFSPAEEKAAFERFMDEMTERWRRFPGFHIYHYAPYETTALKRLMGTYATREEEVDNMLRGEVFVDLHAVVKRAVRASVEKYSIKDMEQFYGYERAFELRDASANLRALERALELAAPESITDEMREAVRLYNKDDCLSTFHLREWLEKLRAGQLEAGEEVPRPAPAEKGPEEELSEKQQRVRDMMERLTEGISPLRAERDDIQQAQWLLAQMLEFYHREDKAVWWEYFRLRDLTDEELLDEGAAIARLEFKERVDTPKRSVVDRYTFPRQETKIRKDAKLKTSGQESETLGTVVAIDPVGRTVDIRKGPSKKDIHPTAVFQHDLVPAGPLEASLMRTGECVADGGIEGDGPARIGRDLLLRVRPRLASGRSGPLYREGETTLEAAKRLVMDLDGGALPIQGPPGCGKTYSGARMIVELVKAGKKVGVTGVSHRVIRNMLRATCKAAEEIGETISCIQKSGDDFDDNVEAIKQVRDNDSPLAALESGEAQVCAGTVWMWARPEYVDAVDVLFVDEAGQMSLANVVAASPSARNMVLLGDPQQLEQPLQGSHPDGTNVSALEHVLGEAKTMPADRGLFLNDTWRLHPDICAFTSELFYEGRLGSVPGLENQAIRGDTPFAGSGLWYVPVAHQGNQNHSPEEVEAVAQLVEGLVGGGLTYTDAECEASPLGLEDILIVAPYGVQVSELSERLPGARVGTVDKFQGQEAPIVIYSLTTSSPEEAPRGMEFLYSLNRLNVATSRARAECILVACPDLFQPECRTPRQMKLANALCRYGELAGVHNGR